MCRWAIVLFLLVSAEGFGAPNDSDPKLDAVIQGCVRQAHRDRICDGLITLRDVGTDSIEAVKEYVALGIYEYYALTALNYAATGRFRIRFPIFKGKWQTTFDARRDSTEIIFSTQF